jgi:hypothetical protein
MAHAGSAVPALALGTQLPPPANRAVVAPLSEATFKVQFTASRAFRDKLRQAQDLLRHRMPDGDLAAILENALDLLIARVQKERFAAGRKTRTSSVSNSSAAATRHVPDAMKREVYERDGGRCTFVDGRGRRCAETGNIEIDHLDGFARTRVHSADRMRLLCRAHNQHAAEKMYGRDFMERKRAASSPSIRPGADPHPDLFSEAAAELPA